MNAPMREPIPFHRAPQLPVSTHQLERKSLRTRTLNDFVEDIFLVLYDSSEQFRSYLEAVGNEDAVEGLTIADDFMAAQMIREEAASKGSPVASKNLAAIRRALGVVTRRWQISRLERRRLIGGQIVPREIEE